MTTVVGLSFALVDLALVPSDGSVPRASLALTSAGLVAFGIAIAWFVSSRLRTS